MMLETPVHLSSTRVLAATATSDTPPQAVDLPAEWSELPSGVIDGGEIVLLAIKPSMWGPLLDALPWILATLGFSALILVLHLALPGLTPFGSARLVLAVGFVRLLIGIARWVATWYVLTNRRILDVRGARTPRIGAMALVEVRNTYLNASVPERVARVASIRFVSKHSDRLPCVWEFVPKPELVHAKIRRAIENALDQYGL